MLKTLTVALAIVQAKVKRSLSLLIYLIENGQKAAVKAAFKVQ